MVKFVSMLLLLLMTSGCCEVFGICTSVHVHTSAESPNKFARLDMNGVFDRLGPRSAQTSLESGLRPAGAFFKNHDVENEFRTCS